MLATTLIGLTQEERDRVQKELDHELFQLEEIARHYEARMRRRDQKRDIMRKLAYATSVENWDKYKARWAKLNELDKHDTRDRIRWHASTNRHIDLLNRWNQMWDELQAAKAAKAS